MYAEQSPAFCSLEYTFDFAQECDYVQHYEILWSYVILPIPFDNEIWDVLLLSIFTALKIERPFLSSMKKVTLDFQNFRQNHEALIHHQKKKKLLYKIIIHLISLL